MLHKLQKQLIKVWLDFHLCLSLSAEPKISQHGFSRVMAWNANEYTVAAQYVTEKYMLHHVS